MNFKKLLALVLAMLFSLIPTAFAQDSSHTEQAASEAYAELPESFDGRECGLVTAVETQISGTCWAHAILAALESNAILQGFSDNSLDLCEYHTVWNSINGYYEGVTDSKNDGYIRTDIPTMMKNGSTAVKSGYALLNFAGAVSESELSFQSTETTSLITEMQSKLQFSNKYNRAISAGEIVNIGTDPDDMKRALLKYGGLYFAYIYYNDGYSGYSLSGDPIQTYFTKDHTSTRGDHAVELIGWDDNFSVDNFGAGPRPSKPGAWLLKNSKGADWGTSGGFFWISYEDPGLYECYAIQALSPYEYENVYLYDGTGCGKTLSCTASANVFTADEDFYLTKFSVGAALNANYTLKVYQLGETYTGPTDGKLLYTQTGNLNNRRYVDLSEKLMIAKGKRFSLVVEGPSSCYVEGSSSSARKFQSKPGESYYYNGSWTDSSLAGNNNVCIRAIGQTVRDSYTVDFVCPGYHKVSAQSHNGSVALPETDGYTWVLRCGDQPFDGQNVMCNMTVMAHCYPNAGTVAEDCPCRREYRCIYCGAEQKEATTNHSYIVDDSSENCLVAPANCKHPAIHCKVCSVCGAANRDDTYYYGACGAHHYAAEYHSNGNGTHSFICAECEGRSEAVSCSWRLASSTSGADCRSTGIDTYVCTVCGAVKAKANNSFGPHQYSGTKCALCGKSYSFAERVVNFLSNLLSMIRSVFGS